MLCFALSSRRWAASGAADAASADGGVRRGMRAGGREDGYCRGIMCDFGAQDGRLHLEVGMQI